MTVAVLAPAKINLGLEIVGKRADGYHDIATVFQTISVFDRLRLSTADADRVQVVNLTEQIDSNLISRTLKLARNAGITDRYWRVELEKRIPIAAGLGGASADAAGTMLALARTGNAPDSDLPATALAIGSDVPFLLRGGAALAHGRGEKLEPLPSLTSYWFVLAAPRLELDRKTARLYGALLPGDFSDGSRARRVAAALQALRPPTPADLANAFERPLTDLMPETELLRASLLKAGAPFVALSGAGPTHYTIVSELKNAIRIARSLNRDHPLPMRILIARPTGAGPLLRWEKTIRTAGTL